MSRVLVVDDHHAIRQGLRALIDAEPGLEVCGVAETGELALERAPLLLPDVVIMDVSMPGMGGILATRAIMRRCPQTQVLMLTSCVDPVQVQEALDAGANGYLLKQEEHGDLIEAVRAVARGERRLSPDVRRVPGAYR